jgi:AcrR family transcriptional regulator
LGHDPVPQENQSQVSDKRPKQAPWHLKDTDAIELTPRQLELLEAALRVFNRKGYDASRTREIASEAGVSEATLFKHFPTKRHILNALMQPFLVTVVKPVMLASVKALVQAHKGGSLGDVLREIMRDRIALFRARAPLITTFIFEAFRHPDLLDVVRTQVIPEIMELIDTVLVSARERGEVGDIDRLLFARSFMSLLVGHVALSGLFPTELGGDSDESAVEGMVDLFLHGVGRRKGER